MAERITSHDRKNVWSIFVFVARVQWPGPSSFGLPEPSEPIMAAPCEAPGWYLIQLFSSEIQNAQCSGNQINGSCRFVLLLFLSLRSLPGRNQAPVQGLEEQQASPGEEDPERNGYQSAVAALPLPPEYNVTSSSRESETQSQFCKDRFGTKFLEDFRDRRADYCSEGSSSLTCFHTVNSGSFASGSLDSFCVARDGTFFDIHGHKFALGCQIRGLSDQEKVLGAASFQELQSYQYLTGPKYLLSEWEAMFSPDDFPRTDIIILDEYPDGPYFELFSMVSGRKPLRLTEWVESRRSRDNGDIGAMIPIDKIIIPLAGAANPLWSDWVSIECRDNSILRVFVQRVFDFYGIPRIRHRDTPSPHTSSFFLLPSPPRLNVSIVVRKNSRKLIGIDELLFEAAKVKFSHVADIRLVDFEGKPFQEQIQIARDTDVLVGMHGAGFTHVLEFYYKPEDWSFACSDPKVTGGEKSYMMCKNRAASDDWYQTCNKKEASDIWWMTRYIMEKDRFLNLIGDAIEAVQKREMDRKG
ncbi:hypothetical protein J7T55_012846 [Diaporthe amygdali]|uniref:uncharacterized protein n=1 Tax=Phomopsis amygdali TaxID=1214568 RepID=UPI0022FEFA54|nr:uncharacterized protein J7T55_012846 [Diaporthe amygdali]KAJ0118594.1 hypothetical protein J7T55_012846 [Diaporthe amygdali]